MDTLVLKLILTPVLIGAASLAGRRWGPAVSGWLIGLPFTSGPIALFLALDHGVTFARAAAIGILAGTMSQAVFCVTYGRLAPRVHWTFATLVSSAAFLAATVALRSLRLPAPVFFLAAAAALGVALRLMPRVSAAESSPPTPPGWDLPARMVVATAFVVLLTEAAASLGPYLTGLLAPFPLYAAVLTAFAHQLQGPDSAIRLLRGLLLGLFAFASFFLVLVMLLEPVGIVPAFAAAIVVTLGVQGGSLWILQHAPGSRRGVPGIR